MVKLSIVIVSYNTREILKELLGHLSNLDLAFCREVIVIDNDSSDGSADMIECSYPDIHLIRNDENIGFARACNMGIDRAAGQYVLFLNPDTKVVDDALDKLVSFLDDNEEAAVATGRVVYPDMTDQGVARTFPTPINSLFGRRSVLTRVFPNNKYSRKYLASKHEQSGLPFEVDWVSGACLMIRKQVLDEVGHFDDKFFMYWEDADLCYRVKQNGGRVFCVADAIIIHYEGKSSGKKKARLMIEFNKSIYHYYRKHHVKRFYSVKNLFAIVGLTTRTVILLFINVCKVRHLEK